MEGGAKMHSTIKENVLLKREKMKLFKLKFDMLNYI
jgi:hypothetical protein